MSSGDEVISFEERRRKADAQHVVAEVVKDTGVLTHDGVADIFASRYEGKLRYCHQSAAWFEFDGVRWKRDDRSRAFEFVRDTNREISTGREIKELKTLRSTGFAKAVELFAKGDRRLAVGADHWDQDRYLLGTPGGIVDLRTGVMRPCEPEDFITKATAVAPAADNDCPVWEGFLKQAAGGDAELIRFLQQWCGYSLSGDIKEHALVFIYGPGGNGKGVFANTVTRILGDYAKVATMETFISTKSDKHLTEVAMLAGARFVTASETEKGRHWNESRLKQMTGGDGVTANFMRQDHFTYVPQLKLTITGNFQPELKNVDDAVKRRLNIIPFLHRPAQPDQDLQEKLREEWPEILRWAIKGCLDWQKHGLVKPKGVIAATEKYFSSQDLLGQWLAEYCELQPGNDRMRETSTILHQSWSAFAKQAGIQPESVKSFVGSLETKVPDRYADMHGKGFEGIRLRRKI